MDWSEKNLCIKCNEGINLLVCSETGCPLSIHEKCMGCPARFDDVGRFYCPYCLYKQAVAESRQAREYALARKKALLIFMDEDIIGGEKQPEVNEGAEANNGHNNQSKVSEANVNITTTGDEENKDSGAENEKNPEEEQKISDEEEIRDEVHEEASEASSSRDKKTPEDEIETSSGSSGLDSVPLQERAKRALKRRKTMHGDSEAVSVKSKSVEQSDKNKQTSSNVNSPRRSSRRLSSATNRTEEVKNEKVEVPKKLKKSELSSVKL
ncbi:hypothetical protein PHJA_002730600 [Phtheirospermum japonicum]|uniref:Zinc finger PHD-type domain-containing protein n=1 Tax=Phtheirospermum japonicum TaxID=374723 RepID=A0A830DGB2_9LAMI|nr:hypothetical protein PHJA_002730600 [Phtheirospermum japonicum]